MTAGILDSASLLWAAALSLGGAAMLPGLSSGGRDRQRRLHTLVTLLRAADPATRIDALERAAALEPGERARLARLLRKELVAGTQTPPAQALTTWFIRQILALLGDSRLRVRTDAARMLRDLISRAERGEDTSGIAPAVAVAVELAGGTASAKGAADRDNTRMLAFAEMLEAGLQPIVVGIQSLEQTAEGDIGSLLAGLRDRNPRVRRSLCEVLAAMGGERATELLISLLDDPSPELRARAAEALGGLAAEPATDKLTGLLRDRVAEVRSAAASALASIGRRAACPGIIAALREECSRADGNEAAQAAMIRAVATLASPTLPELADAMEEISRPIAARLAAALERTGLIEAALSDPHWCDEPAILGALLAKAAGLGAIAPLISALDAIDDAVRQRAAAALGNSRDPAALMAVVGVLEDPDSEVRSEAVAAVAKMADPRALSPLARAATDPEEAVRRGAVTGLHQVLLHRGSWRREALPPDVDLRATLLESHRALLIAAKDTLEAVRVQAAGGLGLFASPEAAEALVELALGDGSEAVRTAAAEGLGRCGFAQTRRLLVSALGEEAEERRRRAVSILGVMGEAEGGPHLLEALRDRSAAVREAALFALARLEVQPLKERLAAELRNRDPRVRAGAAALLGKARAAEYVGELVGALADPEEDVRVNALTALGALGRPVRKHQHDLTARLSDPSPRVREVAAAALASLRESWAEAPDISAMLRRGELSPAAAEAVVETAIEGNNGPLLRALENLGPARSLGAYLTGRGWPLLTSLLTAVRQSADRDRTRLLAGLAQALQQQPIESLLAHLRSVDPEVRLTAVDVSALLGTAEATAALAAELAREPVLQVRSQIVSALADLPEDAAREALLRAQTEDPSMAVRLAATRALNQEQAEPGDEHPGVTVDIIEAGGAGEGQDSGFEMRE
jgi:HEAT repeat protein